MQVQQIRGCRWLLSFETVFDVRVVESSHSQELPFPFLVLAKKIRWRGTLVAAKCIKSAKIRKEWAIKQALENLEEGGDVDEAIRDIDEAEMSQNEKDEAYVTNDMQCY